jgi:hypothetical protein
MLPASCNISLQSAYSTHRSRFPGLAEAMSSSDLKSNLLRVPSRIKTRALITFSRIRSSNASPILPPFEYQPIDAAGEIRILVLQPAHELSDPLETTTFVRNFADYDSAPYVCVSYSWGTLHKYVMLRCNHQYIQVTTHVDTMLRYLRSAKKPVYLWIDAVCINQTDEREKAVQVQSMGRIYSRASEVLVWLGEATDTDQIEGVCESLQEIARRGNDEHGTSKTWRPTSSQEVGSLSSFLNRPWFSRRWVLQEVAMNTNVTVHCGNYQISWVWVQTALKILNHISADERKNNFELLSITSISAIESIATLYWENRTILDLLWSCHSTKCADQRDRLFALYAMAPLMPARSRGLPSQDLYTHCPVTYSDHWTKIYIKFAAFMVGRGHWSTILQHALAFGTLSRENEVWPSWVPSWNQQRIHGYTFTPSATFATSSGCTRPNMSTTKVKKRADDSMEEVMLLPTKSKGTKYENIILFSKEDGREPTISQCHTMLQKMEKKSYDRTRLRYDMAWALYGSIEEARSALDCPNPSFSGVFESLSRAPSKSSEQGLHGYEDLLEQSDISYTIRIACEREFGCDTHRYTDTHKRPTGWLTTREVHVWDQTKFREETNRLTQGYRLFGFKTNLGVVPGLTARDIREDDVVFCPDEETVTGSGPFSIVLRPYGTTAEGSDAGSPVYRLVGGCVTNYTNSGGMCPDEVLIF